MTATSAAEAHHHAEPQRRGGDQWRQQRGAVDQQQHVADDVDEGGQAEDADRRQQGGPHGGRRRTGRTAASSVAVGRTGRPAPARDGQIARVGPSGLRQRRGGATVRDVPRSTGTRRQPRRLALGDRPRTGGRPAGGGPAWPGRGGPPRVGRHQRAVAARAPRAADRARSSAFRTGSTPESPDQPSDRGRNIRTDMTGSCAPRRPAAPRRHRPAAVDAQFRTSVCGTRCRFGERRGPAMTRLSTVSTGLSTAGEEAGKRVRAPWGHRGLTHLWITGRCVDTPINNLIVTERNRLAPQPWPSAARRAARHAVRNRLIGGYPPAPSQSALSVPA